MVVRGSVFHDAMENPIRMVGTDTNITERKRIEEALCESEARYRAMFERNRAVKLLIDSITGAIVNANPAASDFYGYDLETLRAMKITDINQLPPEQVQAEMQRASQEQRAYFVFQHRLASGEIRDVEVHSSPLEMGGRQLLYSIIHDITDRKQAEEAVQRQQQFLHQVIDSAPALIFARDHDGHFTLVNQTMADVYGTTVEALLGTTDADMHLDAHELEQIWQEDKQVMDTGTELVIPERHIKDAHGHNRSFYIVKRLLTMPDDSADQVLVVATDITARKEAELQLQHLNALLQQQVIRDPLTGLHNRRYLDETLPRELQRAERQGQPVGCIMLDIDYFKPFNDTYGHDAGDTVLRAVSTFLQQHTRGEDIACRYGGEEFTLVLPGASLADTQQRARELRTGIQALVVKHGGQALAQVTISLGVAVFPEHGTTADSLIRAADQALYQAKRNGRNRVEVGTILHSEA
jgi:diguanylate cyclase (GGDEF)-like protein/PAS domain S-box-containing protein